jgi:hypothetical protein
MVALDSTLTSTSGRDRTSEFGTESMPRRDAADCDPPIQTLGFARRLPLVTLVTRS